MAEVDTLVFVGQSNMNGVANPINLPPRFLVGGDPSLFPEMKGCWSWDRNPAQLDWREIAFVTDVGPPATDPTNRTWFSTLSGGGYGFGFGPEAIFMEMARNRSELGRVAMFKYARDSASQSSQVGDDDDWNVAIPDIISATTGEMDFETQFTQAMGTFLPGDTPNIVGILEIQGEQDAAIATTDEFYQNKLDLIQWMRDLVGDVPYYLGTIQLESDIPDDRTAAIVTSQMRLSEDYPYVHLVSLEGLTLLDGIHLDAPSQIEAGRRFYEAVYGDGMVKQEVGVMGGTPSHDGPTSFVLGAGSGSKNLAPELELRGYRKVWTSRSGDRTYTFPYEPEAAYPNNQLTHEITVSENQGGAITRWRTTGRTNDNLGIDMEHVNGWTSFTRGIHCSFTWPDDTTTHYAEGNGGAYSGDATNTGLNTIQGKVNNAQGGILENLSTTSKSIRTVTIPIEYDPDGLDNPPSMWQGATTDDQGGGDNRPVIYSGLRFINEIQFDATRPNVHKITTTLVLEKDLTIGTGGAWFSMKMCQTDDATTRNYIYQGASGQAPTFLNRELLPNPPGLGNTDPDDVGLSFRFDILGDSIDGRNAAGTEASTASPTQGVEPQGHYDQRNTGFTTIMVWMAAANMNRAAVDDSHWSHLGWYRYDPLDGSPTGGGQADYDGNINAMMKFFPAGLLKAGSYTFDTYIFLTQGTPPDSSEYYNNVAPEYMEDVRLER